MKRFAFSLFVASITMNTVSVLAEVAPLTTQGYVDDGLRAVYRALDEKKADKEDIQIYTAKEDGGIAINENNQVSLDINEPAENAVYVFKNGEWAAYTVNSDFSSAFNNEEDEEKNI